MVGVCDGFVGNRMLHARVGPGGDGCCWRARCRSRWTRVVTEFGFPMGPFAMGDLAGLDVGWRIRKARGASAPISRRAVRGRAVRPEDRRRLLQVRAARTPTPDPEVERIIAEQQRKAGRRPAAPSATRRSSSGMIYPMINEGARILEEGIATRPSDIDVIWITATAGRPGRGGPMFYADKVGLQHIARAAGRHYAESSGDETLRPAKLLRAAGRADGAASVATAQTKAAA